MILHLDPDDEIRLTVPDFPNNYVDLQHPDDLVGVIIPTDPVMTFHKAANHNRLLWRVSFQRDSDGLYVPVTFLCDTGSPGFFYVSDQTRTALGSAIKTDSDLDVDYLETQNDDGTTSKARVDATSAMRGNVNIAGLLLLERYGLKLRPDGFELSTAPVVYKTPGGSHHAEQMLVDGGYNCRPTGTPAIITIGYPPVSHLQHSS